MTWWAAAALIAAGRGLPFPFFRAFSLAAGFAGLSGEPRFLTPADVDALPSKPADARIAYGADERQFGELRLPSGPGPHPVAIVLHGGCWRTKFAGVRNTAALADALRDAGIATWNVEYRAEDSSCGGWPGTFLDAACAADSLRAIASEYSLNLSRVVSIGHSAGGHLALWLAARHRLPESSPLFLENPLTLRGVVSLAGIPDLAAFREHGKTPCEGDVVGGLMGGGPEDVPERYREGSPVEMAPLGVKQVLLVGDADETVPARFAQAYAEQARRVGDDVRVVIVSNCGHHECNAPGEAPWATIRRAVFELVGLP